MSSPTRTLLMVTSFDAPMFRALRCTAALPLLLAVAACGGGGGGDAGPSTAPPVATPGVAPTAGLQVAPLTVPAELFAGSAGSVVLGATGGDGKNSWSVECSSHLACSIADGVLRLESRMEEEQAQGRVTVTVTDGSGARASASQSLTVWPRKLTRWQHSLVGAPDRPGVHLVILADGFSAQEMGVFRDFATLFVNQLFGHPEVAAHKSAWNVHLVELPAGEAASRVQATLGCHSIARLLCVNTSGAQLLAGRFVPHYSEVLVIVNQPAYGGSGGAVAAITRHLQSISSGVHELGHSFAGLADEYTDTASATQYPFIEGQRPNVTAFTDPASIPWKHWIEPGTALPTLGAPPPGLDPVGLYEGAAYLDKGRYRPTYASFMRELGGPFGPVNGEAWVRQVYIQGGAWAQFSPAVGVLLTPAAQPVGGWVFKAEPLLDRKTAETRWYLNGVERADLRGAGQLLVQADGALRVRVELVDLTGRVRLNDGVVSSLNWSVP